MSAMQSRETANSKEPLPRTPIPGAHPQSLFEPSCHLEAPRKHHHPAPDGRSDLGYIRGIQISVRDQVLREGGQEG